jgi:hydrogenase-4 component E
MLPLADALLLLVLLVDFAVLAASRLTFTIRATAFQGVLLALLPLAIDQPWSGHTLFLAAGTLLVKGILLPNVLLWAMREASVRRELEPTLGPLSSIVAGVFSLGLALALGAHLPALGPAVPRLLVATSLTTVMCGFLVFTTRRKAMTQVVGYLLLENGVFVFGLSLAGRVPILIEMGVLLDLLVAVFIMALVVFQMNRELESIDSERLSELRE